MRAPVQEVPTVQPIGAVPARFTQQATPEDFGGRIGQAEQQAAQNLGEGGNELFRNAVAYAGMQNETLARDQNTAFVTEAGKMWGDFATKRGKDAVDAYPNFQKSVSDLAVKMRGQLPNAQAQKFFAEATTRYVDNMILSGAHYSAVQNKEWQIQSSNSRANAAIDQAVLFREDPNQIQIWLNTGKGELLNAGELKGEDKDTVQQAQAEWTGKAMRTVISAAYTDDPTKATKLYERFKDQLSGTYQAAIEGDLARKKDESLSIFRADVERRWNDSYAALSDGQGSPYRPSDLEIKAAFPKDPARADYMIFQLNEGARVGAVRNSISLTSPEEDQRLLVGFNPDASKPNYQAQAAHYNAVTEAMTAKYKALNADPAGYVLGASPQIKTLYTQAQTNPSAMSAYVSALDSTYDQMGVPSYQRPILPAGDAQAVVKKIMTAPPEARAGQIPAMAQTYGEAWPRIMGDLVKAKLPAQYELMAAIPNPAARSALADVLSGKQDPKEVRRSVEESAKDIDQDIDTNPALMQLTRSLSYASGGAMKAGEIVDVARLIAYRFAADGTNASKASARAVAALTSEKYDFWEQGGGVARVPQGKLGQVEIAAEDLLGKLSGSLDTTSAPGMIKPGTITSLFDRPVLKNPDGSVSTTSSMSIGTDEGETLIPTVIGGKRLSNEGAIAHFRQTGEHLGIFKSPEAADDYAEKLHNEQARRMGIGPLALAPMVNTTGVPLTDQQLRDIALKSALGGKWVTNESDSGVIRLGMDGRPVVTADGKRLELSFRAAEAFRPARPTPGEYDFP